MPDRYTLVLEVDAATLAAMSADWRVVVARHRRAGEAHVAWLALRPTGTNTIEWDETYGLYAARPGLRDGEPIAVAAAVDAAVDRFVYPFRDGAFAAPAQAPHVPPRHVDVRNEAPDAVTFGLLQTALVNGAPCRSPLNAIVVPATFTADFTALTAVSVWAERGIAAGSIVRMPAAATTIAFDDVTRTERAWYDGTRFVRTASRASSPSAPAVAEPH